MLYAVIETGGKQYRVEEGMVLDIEKLAHEKGDKVVFDQVKLVGGDVFKFEAKELAKCSIEAEVVDQFRDDKVTIIKFRRRQDSRTKQGHRQYLTRVKITGIKGVQAKKAKAAKAESKQKVEEV